MILLESSIAQRIMAKRVAAVLMIEKIEHAVPTAQALLAGGVDVMELTLRTPVAMDALRAIRAEVPDMLAGIGTILTGAQAEEAKEAGAAFGVSPGTNPRTIQAAQSVGLPFAPGIMTPTDIETALGFGCQLLKFFPAGSSGGLAHLKNIAAPYAHLGLKYIPLGGINIDNIGDYLAHDMIAAVGGSWIAPKDLIAKGDWDAITKNASEAIAARHPM
jgi:2-dehydro-3-deoxyphosphogluconate aldolase/(4S)-4-hydroxy-2-oxoglutarate aldolase